jgi:glycosyltransferase involved in cell wall biosynthesis
MRASIPISVVIPARNRASLIETALASVLAQSHPAQEIIVVDDCSTDGTADIAAQISGVKVIRHTQPVGAQAARNTGILAATHEWIAFNDSDDTWLEDKLREQHRRLVDLDGNVDFVLHTAGVRVDVDSGTVASLNIPRIEGECYAKLLARPGPMFQGLLVHRSKLRQIGLLDTLCPSYQEWDTAIRLASRAKFSFIDRPLFRWHRHGKGSISDDRDRDFSGYFYVTSKHRTEIERVLGPKGWRTVRANTLARGLRLGCFEELRRSPVASRALLVETAAAILARHEIGGRWAAAFVRVLGVL